MDRRACGAAEDSMRNCHLAVYAATALLLSAGVDTSYAQSWTGPYLGGTIGGAMQPNADDRIVRFDKTLDGNFNDTILLPPARTPSDQGFARAQRSVPRPPEAAIPATARPTSAFAAATTGRPAASSSAPSARCRGRIRPAA